MNRKKTPWGIMIVTGLMVTVSGAMLLKILDINICIWSALLGAAVIRSVVGIKNIVK